MDTKDSKDTKLSAYIPPETTDVMIASEGVMTNLQSKMGEEDLFKESF